MLVGRSLDHSGARLAGAASIRRQQGVLQHELQLLWSEWPQRMRGRQLRQYVQQLSGLDNVHG